MKLKILALTALVTICAAAPVAAETVVDFRGADDDGLGIVIVPSRRRHRVYHPYYRRGQFYRPHHRSYHPYYRHGRFYRPRYWNERPRYRYGRFHHPRRGYIQFGVGF